MPKGKVHKNGFSCFGNTKERKKAYEKYEERIKDVSDFVGLAKRELEKTGGKGGEPT